jgi:hypothetical protein
MLNEAVRSCKPDPAPPPDSRTPEVPPEPPPPPETPKKVIGIASLGADELKKIAALALVKYKVPPAHVPNAKDPEVVTVAVPAVIVQVPAPMF